jgi:hypothetical protein
MVLDWSSQNPGEGEGRRGRNIIVSIGAPFGWIVISSTSRRRPPSAALVDGLMPS